LGSDTVLAIGRDVAEGIAFAPPWRSRPSAVKD